MNHFEFQYLGLLNKSLNEGEKREDRTGVGTLSLFGEQLKFDVKADGFPLLTTKRVPFKAVLSELLWFMEGSSDERRLAEILYDTRDINKKTIWSPNVEHTSGSEFYPDFYGDLGRIYGVQWRNWRGAGESYTDTDKLNSTVHIDQLKNVIQTLKTNPTDRRMIVSSWNVVDIVEEKMALPPCHLLFQFYLTQDKVLHCQMYQRSVDVFLGLPFNCASYAILMYIIAKEIDAEPGTLTMCLGDTHLYLNHVDQAKEQLSRDIRPLPALRILTDSPWDKMKMSDFHLTGYDPHTTIHAPMAQ